MIQEEGMDQLIEECIVEDQVQEMKGRGSVGCSYWGNNVTEAANSVTNKCVGCTEKKGG